MHYKLEIEGIEKHRVTLEVEGSFSRPKLFVDGQPAEKGPKKDLFILPYDDGTEGTAWVRHGVFDPSPVVWIDEQEIGIAQPFTWWQWFMIAFPLLTLIILHGGLPGVVFGVLAGFINGRVLRLTSLNPYAKYALLALIFILALSATSIVAALIAGPQKR